MNAPRSERLQRVADIAGKHTDEAASALADRIHRLEAARRQLDELNQFRRDYELQPNPSQGSGVTVAELLNHQQFIARIDEAIIQQQREIEQHTRNLAKARAAWLESRSRSASLDTVTQRYRDKERAGEERADQAALDERMQQRKNTWPSP